MSKQMDPEFAQRVANYQKNLKRGLVFQADGTVGGRRARPQRAAWRSSVLTNLLRSIMMLVFLKVSLFHAAGMIGYDTRSSHLLSSTSLMDTAVAVILYPDPVSLTLDIYLVQGQRMLATQLRAWML